MVESLVLESATVVLVIVTLPLLESALPLLLSEPALVVVVVPSSPPQATTTKLSKPKENAWREVIANWNATVSRAASRSCGPTRSSVGACATRHDAANPSGACNRARRTS
ncbi:MAG: hypothetical protein IPN32_17905 [Deltaproteobacteria bacterium]|nr:hypothetical protein [Deltaproteobacteria bacterium]